MTNRWDHARTYTYDENGNRLTKSLGSLTEHYSYDEADKLTAVTDGTNTLRSYAYDDAGRTTSITEGSATTSFAYDYEGRVTSITYPNTSSDSYGYNGLGARVSSSGTNGSRSWFRNGLGVTSPVLADGNASYTPGVSRTSSGTTSFAHAGLKNTNSQSAENETVAASRVYDAFGNLVSSSGTWSGPFGYAGNFGYQEDPSGLKLLGHRYYSPQDGRFASMDPAAFGSNWYRYCNSSPISLVDFDGARAVNASNFEGADLLRPDGMRRKKGGGWEPAPRSEWERSPFAAPEDHTMAHDAGFFATETLLEHLHPGEECPIPIGLLDIPTAGGGGLYNNLDKRQQQAKELTSGGWDDTSDGGTLSWEYDEKYWDKDFVQSWNQN